MILKVRRIHVEETIRGIVGEGGKLKERLGRPRGSVFVIPLIYG